MNLDSKDSVTPPILRCPYLGGCNNKNVVAVQRLSEAALLNRPPIRSSLTH